MASIEYAKSMLAVWLAGFAFNLCWVYRTSPQADRWRRCRFICRLWPQQTVVVLARFAVMRLVKLSQGVGLDRPAVYWPFILPIGLFEAWSVQAMADEYEGRPLKPLCLRAVRTQLKVSFLEAVGLTVGYMIWPWVKIDDPTVESWLHAPWRTFVFDIGLDVGFYTFHRSCHVNRTLYRWLHAPHHADTGKAHGRRLLHLDYISATSRLSLGALLIGARPPGGARDVRAELFGDGLHPWLVPDRLRAHRPRL